MGSVLEGQTPLYFGNLPPMLVSAAGSGGETNRWRTHLRRALTLLPYRSLVSPAGCDGGGVLLERGLLQPC